VRQPKTADLTGRVVAITGGARGIGLATATACLAAGAKVAIGDLDGELARSEAARLGAFGTPLDVTDPASFAHFLDEVEQTLGPVDVLINNAGIMPLGPLAQEPDVVTQRIVAVNLGGALNGTKAAARRMVPRGSGQIINVASAVGRFAVANAATYSATKYAVIGLTEAMRAELRGTGVTVSVILPAITNTELAAGVADPSGSQPITEPAEVAEAILGVIRKPRFETWVPRSNQRAFKVLQMLPRGVIERAAAKSGAADILATPDTEQRAAYEARARVENSPRS
jgi:NAD(P)-dependent dehydrogenase (short-subunit alcohol dehydrogenase family)